MYSVDLSYSIVPAAEARPGIANPLIRQLAAIESERSLQKAAKSLGVSYRHFWGQIEIWESRLGQKLVVREQGRPARLSPLGEKLLWAERSVMARYALQLEKLRTELNSAVAAACDPEAEIVTVAGCFDPWLATLPAELFPRGVIADLRFSTSAAGLKSLAAGECDMAGFNFPRGAGPDSSAARTFAPLIDPDRCGVCRFAARTQGLAVAPGNPRGVSSLREVADRGLVYAGRAAGTGTEVLLLDLCAGEGVDPKALVRTAPLSSHSAVALAVAAGEADAGLCVENAARGAGADFVPLVLEDYYLVWRRDAEPSALEKILETLSSDAWRSTVVRFAGSSSVGCGTRVDPRAAFGWWN